jgi:hypothetical protein
MVFFAKRMLELENDSKYADMLELALYNGALAGLSLDGKKFFYENPLEISTQKRFEEVTKGRAFAIKERVECFYCSCCPPNVNRLLASLGDYIFGHEDDILYVNQYVCANLKDDKISVKMNADYPVSGAVKLKVNGVNRVALRIPAWCDKFTLNAPCPDYMKIPDNDVLGVTAILLCCLYCGQEFFRCGFYLNNVYDNEEMNVNPPEQIVIDKVVRSILADKPRITKFNIDWNCCDTPIITNIPTMNTTTTNNNALSNSCYMFQGGKMDIEQFNALSKQTQPK